MLFYLFPQGAACWAVSRGKHLQKDRKKMKRHKAVNIIRIPIKIDETINANGLHQRFIL